MQVAVESSLHASRGCHCERPRLAGGNRLVIVVIVRAELRYFRDWVVYHHLLGVDEFVIISNECDADGEGEANLKRSILDIPCAPTFTFVDGFQTRWQDKKLINCASSFQTNAYRQAVQEMRSRADIDPTRTRLLFSDVDEYLVVHGHAGGSSAPADAIFAAGAPNASMWTVPQVLYGSSFRDLPPVGFVPANFVMAAAARCPYCDQGERRELTQHREHKSMCRLSDMLAVADPKQQLFPRDGGRWVHECLATERGVSLPPDKVGTTPPHPSSERPVWPHG